MPNRLNSGDKMNVVYKEKLILLFLVVSLGAMAGYYSRVLHFSGQHVDLNDISYLQQDKDKLLLSIGQLESEISSLEEQINSIANKSIDPALVKQLNDEIEHYAFLTGMRGTSGEGVIIIVDDSEAPMNPYQSPADMIVHDESLRYLVDGLREAGAEAVSINGTRIIFGLSEIICSGPTIRINSIQHGPPFVIRAIGDRYKLQKAMSESNSFANTLLQYGLKVEVNTKVHLKIGRYTGEETYKYAQIKE